jgi:hypothetical protein
LQHVWMICDGQYLRKLSYAGIVLNSDLKRVFHQLVAQGM